MSFKRRDVLQKIGGASAAAFVGASGVVTAKDENGNEIKIEELSGDKKGRVLNIFRNDEEVGKLLSYVSEMGWEPNYVESTAGKTTSETLTKYSVTVPLNNTNYSIEEQNMFISWETSGDFPTTVYHYEDISKESKEDTAVNQTLYSISDSEDVEVSTSGPIDSLKSTTAVAVPDSTTGSQLNISASSTDCYRECEMYLCESYRLECAAQLIFAGLGAIASCGSCGTFDLSRMSCLACISALGLTGVSPFTCNLGKNCSWQYDCVTSSEYRHHWSGHVTDCRVP